jgi:transposase
MRPLSNDLRERIIAAVDHHEGSRREIARRFGVDVSWITRLLQRRRDTGSIELRPRGGGKTPWLDQKDLERLRLLVAKHPDATLRQWRDRLGVGGSIMIIWRAPRSLGITRKKKPQHAGERNRPDVQKKRESFREEIATIAPRRLVFVAETGVTTAITATDGRAPRGERVVDSAPASWESMTVIAALGLDGVDAPLAISGSINAATFLTYVAQVLVPALRQGDVVVFDNLASPLTPGVQTALEQVGASMMPLPPYRPDLNPIDEMFSKFKEALRGIAARTKNPLVDASGATLKTVTTQDILGWFQQAGLCVTQT